MQVIRKIVLITLLITMSGAIAACQNQAPPENTGAKPVPAETGSNADNLPTEVREPETDQYYQQGLSLYQQNRYADAVVWFDRAVEANPADYRSYADRGIALCFMGKYSEGMASINKSLEIRPDYVPAYYDMAMGYKLQNNYDQAIVWFQKVIDNDPQNTWSYYGIATIYADRGQQKPALEYLSKAIAIDPGVKDTARSQAHFKDFHDNEEFERLVR